MGKWLRLLGGHAGNQLSIQLLGFISGILIVRGLPKDGYAQYSIAVAVIAAATLLSDAGLSAALMSRGSALLADDSALSRLFASGLKFRRRVGLVIIAAGAAWVFVLSLLNGAQVSEALLYAILLAIGLVPVMASGVILVYHRLRVNLRLIQRAGLGIAVGRTLVIACLVGTGFASVTSLLLVTAAVSTGYAWVLMRAASSVRADVLAPEHRVLFISSMRATLPVTLSLIVAEQFLLVLLSTRGNAEVIAELSAMSRFGVAFVVLNALVVDVVAPAFAKIVPARRALLSRAAISLSAYATFCIILLISVSALSTVLVGLLGPGYAGLEVPLVCVAGGFAMANMAGVLNALNNARGWMAGSWSYLPLVSVWGLSVLLFPDLQDISQVSLAFLLQAVPAVLTQMLRFAIGVKRASRTGFAE